MVTTQTVEHVCKFLKWTDDVRKEFEFEEGDPFTPWFRGQENAALHLVPTLYRPEYGGPNRLKDDRVEDEIREEFAARAPTLCEGIPSPEDDWGWYFLMQHFGAPTRLLDWTEVPLLALYFAVKKDKEPKDAAVWALDPYRLNKNVFKRLYIRTPYEGQVICPIPAVATPKERERVKWWLPERRTRKRHLPQWPVAVYPAHTARRISTQHSNFTIHGDDARGLDEMTPELRRCLFGVRIPSTRVRSIRRELERNGIDESLAFPDLGGLGRSLWLKWRSDSNPPHNDAVRADPPHEGVYTRLGRSEIQGVGVIAIRRIKKGTRLFWGDDEEMLWVDEKDLPKRPKEIRRLYDDFAVIDRKRRYGCPRNFNCLTMSWYINEPRNGESPNVRADPETYDFYAIKDIAVGEELTVRYDSYSERTRTPSRRTRQA